MWNTQNSNKPAADEKAEKPKTDADPVGGLLDNFVQRTDDEFAGRGTDRVLIGEDIGDDDEDADEKDGGVSTANPR